MKTLLQVAKYGSSDVVELKVSYAETLDEVKTKALDALKIPAENRADAQFLIDNNGKYEPILPTISSAKLSSLLSMELVVYVDETGKVLEKLKADEVNGNAKTYGYATAVQHRPSERYVRGLCGLQNLGRLSLHHGDISPPLPSVTCGFRQHVLHEQRPAVPQQRTCPHGILPHGPIPGRDQRRQCARNWRKAGTRLR